MEHCSNLLSKICTVDELGIPLLDKSATECPSLLLNRQNLLKFCVDNLQHDRSGRSTGDARTVIIDYAYTVTEANKPFLSAIAEGPCNALLSTITLCDLWVTRA